MIFFLTVLSAPDTSTAPARALAFAEAALSAGCCIDSVFFYGAGARCAHSSDSLPAAGGAGDWLALARRAGCTLAVCSKSAQRHGCADLLQKPFALCGLGELIDAALSADRSVVFSD